MFSFPSRKDIPVSLGDLQSEMNNLFARLWHSGLSTKPFDGQEWAPLVDLYEEPDRFVVKAEIPGLDAAAIELSFADGELTLKGSKCDEFADEQAEATSVHRERRFGHFCRSVSIPGSILASEISAACHNGLLEIALPKKEDTRPRSIKIEVSE